MNANNNASGTSPSNNKVKIICGCLRVWLLILEQWCVY